MSPLKFENLTVSIYYYVSFIILPKICPLCLGWLDSMLLLNQVGWKSVKWEKKTFCVNAGAEHVTSAVFHNFQNNEV